MLIGVLALALNGSGKKLDVYFTNRPLSDGWELLDTSVLLLEVLNVMLWILFCPPIAMVVSKCVTPRVSCIVANTLAPTSLNSDSAQERDPPVAIKSSIIKTLSLLGNLVDSPKFYVLVPSLNPN